MTPLQDSTVRMVFLAPFYLLEIFSLNIFSHIDHLFILFLLLLFFYLTFILFIVCCYFFYCYHVSIIRSVVCLFCCYSYRLLFLFIVVCFLLFYHSFLSFIHLFIRSFYLSIVLSVVHSGLMYKINKSWDFQWQRKYYWLSFEPALLLSSALWYTICLLKNKRLHEGIDKYVKNFTISIFVFNLLLILYLYNLWAWKCNLAVVLFSNFF